MFLDCLKEKREQNIFNEIKDVIIEIYVRSFIYFNYYGNHGFRLIRPLKPLILVNAGYAYCFCGLRNVYRFFKFIRLNQLNITDNKEKKIVPMENLDKINKKIKKVETILVFMKYLRGDVMVFYGKYERDE